MNDQEQFLNPSFDPQLAFSSPVIIGPKLPSDDLIFFSTKQKQNSLENVILSFPSFPELEPHAIFNLSNSASHCSNLNMKCPSNNLSNNLSNRDSLINSNKESIHESSSNKQKNDDLDLKAATISRSDNYKNSLENNQSSIPLTQTQTNKTTLKKKIDIKKTLTAIFIKANPKNLIDKFLDSVAITILVNFLTVFVLFADDIRTSAFTITADPIFDILTITCLGIFSIEILLQTLVRKDYFLSFFFYLDVISTVSLLFDIQLFEQAILLKNNASTNAAQMSRMSRASRIGTRAARIIRLVRLIRIVKLYKAAVYKQEQNMKKKLEKKSIPNVNMKINKPSILLMKENGAPKKLSNFNMNTKKDSSVMTEINFSKKRESVLSPNNGLQPRLSKFSNNSPSPLLNNHRLTRLSNASEMPRLKSRLSHKWYMNNTPNNSGLQSSPLKSLKSPNSIHSFLGIHESLNPEGTEKDNSLLEIQDEIKLKESVVGKKLSERSTKRVIIIVLLLIIIIPLFDSTFYFDPSYSFLSGVAFLSKVQDPNNGTLLISQSDLEAFCQSYISNEITNTLSTLISLSTPFYNTSCFYFQSINPTSVRFDEKYAVEVALEYDGGMINAVVDQSLSSYYTAIINMIRTIFVTVVLLTGCLLFSRDANELVLNPIERLIEKVHKIAENPLGIKEFKLASESHGMANELILIENSILKIGTLLALGFGEAGREIIASNMNKGGNLDFLTRGCRKFAVYGFCDIRNFTDATEVLQEEVMVFVNNIAEIVHGIVDRCLGSANKNIGDAFLLVWKLPDLSEDFLLIPSESRKVTDICDLAVFSFLKIIGKLNRHPRILQYRTHPKLASRFKDYKVRLGFGMHYGWSIEGAIGSDYKIDASYLSPNVNIASRLEAATKQYGVPFLFSSDLYRCLSEDVQKFARKIDLVTLKGSLTPMGLYTIDVVTDGMPPSKPEVSKDLVIKKRRLQKEAILTLYDTKNFKIKDLFCYDKEIKLLLKMYENELGIRHVFDQGLREYLAGDWKSAKEYFEAFVGLKGREDSPTNVLMDFMKKNYWKCPEDWPGYRELIEK